ncbi:MAG: hypothetical protein JW888_16075 [Pirellulales bacterium]|nr:hypothetical protein [Pirellulales bacterium]
MYDVLSLEYAIYFIGPPLVLYAAAHIFGSVLTFVAQFFVEREVSHDEATYMMTFVIAATAAAAALVQWTTGILWAAVAAGSTASYVVGAFLFSRSIEDYTPSDRKEPIAPIGPNKGSLISAVITSIGLILTLLAVWAAGRAT